jgi:hypothetical protein
MESWWVLVTDSDKNLFSLHGPVSDHTEWTNKVGAAQGRGQKVTCSTIPASEDASAIRERARSRGLTEGEIILAGASN